MKVVYKDGTVGELTAEQSKNLYIQNRFTKREWEELEEEMNRLGIIEFADPFVSMLSDQLTHIEYVRNQIAAH